MNKLKGMSSVVVATLMVGTTLPQIAIAAPQVLTEVANVSVNPSKTGVDLVLNTPSSSKAPQVFNTNRGNTWTAFLFNAKLAGNQPLKQDNPAPGIASIVVTPMKGNGVQVTVVGNGKGSPVGQMTRKDNKGVAFSITGKPGTQVAPTAQTTPVRTAQATPVAPFVPAPTAPRTAPVAPNSIVPPLMPRAVAPPLGDFAISQIDTSGTAIDLGSNERIPRLVLRDAPVREVLSLLARAAGVNLAFSESSVPAGGGGAPGAGAQSGGPTISLDIENESVQDVFNYVLRIACVPATTPGGGGGGGQCSSLEANRVGRTVFVGSRLPDDARNVISRTIRLNQVNSADAAAFLTTQGAETQRPFEEIEIQTIGEGAAARTVERRRPTIISLRATEGTGPLLLKTLSVSSNDRLNTITLTGTPRKIEMATSLLGQLDLRKRQASVQVKIIDINLLGLNQVGTSFSFRAGDSSFVNQAGLAVFNFGANQLVPATLGISSTATNIGSAVIGASQFGGFGVQERFSAQLQAAIQSQNAKILTDPTLTIQEGQRSQVKLVEEVLTNFKIERTGTGDAQTTTITTEKGEAGLNLDILMERIDDNGFISLQIQPRISAIARTEAVNLGNNSNTLTLLQKREVTTGSVRVRDGQTLLLTGVIQDSDRATVTKVPILGDIPLLGALFRRTSKTSERREVLIMVTPRVIDDSDKATFGYGYNPSAEAQKVLQQSR